MKNKKGISLIVLVITIIVLVILAGTVIITFVKNNPISAAKNATEKWNEKVKEEEEILKDIDWQISKTELLKENPIRTYEAVMKKYYGVTPDTISLYQSIDSTRKTFELYGYKDSADLQNNIFSFSPSTDQDEANAWLESIYDTMMQMSVAEAFYRELVADNYYMEDSKTGKKFYVIPGPDAKEFLDDLKKKYKGIVLPDITSTSTDTNITAELYEQVKNIRETGYELGLEVADGSPEYIYDASGLYLEKGQLCYTYTAYNPDTSKFDLKFCIPLINACLIGLDSDEIYYVDENCKSIGKLPF